VPFQCSLSPFVQEPDKNQADKQEHCVERYRAKEKEPRGPRQQQNDLDIEDHE
jgi:hypothetical protein